MANTAFQLEISLVVLSVISLLLLFLFLRERKTHAVSNPIVGELRSQIEMARSELEKKNELLMATRDAQTSATAILSEGQKLHEANKLELDEAKRSLLETRSLLAHTEADLKVALAQINNLKEQLKRDQTETEEKLRLAKEAQNETLGKMALTFKSLSTDALKETFPEFIQQATRTLGAFQEAAKGDLETRKVEIAGLIKPLEENLKAYQARLQQGESVQTATLAQVREQLSAVANHSQALANETLQFRMVLKSNQARGKWGEETLRRVVEAAGMSAHCDFQEQQTGDDVRPDMIVSLPGDRKIIVDSKVPSLDFLGAIDAADDSTRMQSLKKHAASLRETIKDLAKKNYPDQFPGGLDLVVLFLPAESLFSAALEADRDLIVWAAREKITLATPASLIALLRSVALSWQQYEQTQNARKIAAEAEELYTRVATFLSHFSKIRDGIDSAAKSFNLSIGSYEKMVRPQGERLKELGISLASNKIFPDVPLATDELRVPQLAMASEKLGSEDTP